MTRLNTYLNFAGNTKEAFNFLEKAMSQQVWGDYFGRLKDRVGVQWMINYSPPKEG